jgi:hypothetical protein
MIKTQYDIIKNMYANHNIVNLLNQNDFPPKLIPETDDILIVLSYTILNSQTIAKFTGMNNITLYKILNDLNDILLYIANTIKDTFNIDISHTSKDILFSPHLKAYFSHMPLLITYSKDMDDNLYILNPRIFGQQMNKNDSNAMGAGWYSFYGDMSITFAMFKESLINKFANSNLFTMFIHEWSHDFNDDVQSFITDARIAQLLDNNTFTLIKQMWNDNFIYELDEPSFLREFIGDYLGIFCIEKELDRILNLNDKYTFISYSYNWVCNEHPSSKISAGHPHHSLRLNVLLLSKKIQKILIEYQKKNNAKNIKVHTPHNNPACNEMNIEEFKKKSNKIKSKIDNSLNAYEHFKIKKQTDIDSLRKLNNDYQTSTIDEHNKNFKPILDEMNDYNSYMNKYLKYKQKYLQLKNKLS